MTVSSSSPTRTSEAWLRNRWAKNRLTSVWIDRHPGGVDGRDQRGDRDAVQDPVRRDRQDQPDGGVDAAQRGHEQQRDAERGVLEPVGHPAMGRHRPAPHQDGQQQGDGRPRRRRRVPAAELDGRPAEHQQPDEQRHVDDVDAGRPASAGQLDVGRDVEAASSPISSQGSLAENMARRIVSAASDQVNENRRIFVRAVASAVRKWISETPGTSGRIELVQREDLAAEEVVLRAQGQPGLGRDCAGRSPARRGP